jgi:hypothetical protein
MRGCAVHTKGNQDEMDVKASGSVLADDAEGLLQVL